MKFPMCNVSEIINPGMYVVVTCDEEHASEVKRLEERMSEEMSNTEIPSDAQLIPKMVVAVTDLKGNLVRGLIAKETHNNTYEVLLMDYGRIITVDKSAIRMIGKEDFIKVEPLAFQVKLYGLIPAKYIFHNGKRKLKACAEWRPESREFVEDLLNKNQKIVVQIIMVDERTVYGDLLVKDKSQSKYVSLRKQLCKNQFSAYSERVFLKVESLNPPDDTLGMETKMDFVRKWHEKNFGEFRKNPYQLPAINPNSSIPDAASLGISNSKSAVCDGIKPNKKEASVLEGFENSDELASIGKGRGKLLLMLNKEEVEAKCRHLEAFDNDSSEKLEKKSRAIHDRGKYLEACVGRESAVMTGSLSGLVEAETKPKMAREMKSVDVGMKRTRAASVMEKAVVKPGEFPELNDSNGFSEASISFEDDSLPPSLVQSAGIRTEENRGHNELEAEENKMSVKDLSCQRKEDDGKEEAEGRECSRWKGIKALRGKRANVLELERPSNPYDSNNCWIPYVLFDDSVVESVNSFKDLPIQQSIIKVPLSVAFTKIVANALLYFSGVRTNVLNLEEMNILKSLSLVQRWAIPAIRKQHNTIVIGGSKTGKTLSYLVPLVDYVQDEVYFEELPRGNGPSVVILASSSRVCESIYLACRTLLGESRRTSKVRVLLAYGGGREEEMWVFLTNGCDVLISTPPCLVRLLEFPVVTNLERLTCLVLDEIEVISQNPFRKYVRTILEKAELSTKGRHYQRILCGEKWTGKVESLVKAYVKSYAVVIGSYLEAVVYERLTPSIFLVDKEQKTEILWEELKERRNLKVVVFCKASKQVILVSKFLSEKGIKTLVAHEKVLSERLKETETTWKNSRRSVLIMSDGVLSEVDVKEAQVLIHYDLPSKSKTNFFLRYTTVLNFYKKQRTFEKAQSRNRTARVLIFIDDENHSQLPHIAEFVTRLGGKLPEKIVERCGEIQRLVEMSKCCSPICENLLSLGRCRKWKQCPQRHTLVKALDSPDDLPRSGWVNFVVMKALNASVMAVRLLEHVGVNGTVRKLEQRRWEEVRARVRECFVEKKSRRPVGAVKVGDVCGVRCMVREDGKKSQKKKKMKNEEEEEVEETFYRAKVIEVVGVDKYEMPTEVRVKLLDEGDVWRRKVGELFELPEELGKEPPSTVDVRMVGVQALDFDVSWSELANAFVREVMTQKLKENQYWSGKVVLALKNTLFLESIKRKQFLPHLNVHVFDLMVREELLNNKIAVANPEHLPALYKLSKEAGIDMSGKEELRKEDSAKVEPQWAYFDAGFVKVRFLAAENTSRVFLQPKKFEKLLNALEEDCQKEGVTTAKDVKARKGKKSMLSVGSYCLARFEDGKWNRGRVESENEDQFYVLFIDHGDFLFVQREDVVPISLSLLLRLPCQAIECRLVGIEEVKECPREVLEEIYAFSDDGKQDLYAYIANKETKAEITHGRKYDVNLMNKKGVSLNQMLIDGEMVVANEKESHYLEMKDIEEAKDSEEEEEEEEDREQQLSGEKETEELIRSEQKSLSGYFEGLRDDVFKDENAMEFLKEFASKLFPKLNGLVEMDDDKEILSKPEPAEKRGLRPLEEQNKLRTRKEFELKSRDNVLTPQVLWWQTQEEIRMRILLGSVVDYSLECSERNVSFRCVLGQKLYAVDLRLFGAVNPQMTVVTTKAFDVSVVMRKLASPPWPRLQLDEGKHRWISLDVEGLRDKEGEFGDKIVTVKREIEAGRLKEGIRDERIEPCSDSERSDKKGIFSDSEDSEDDFL